MGKNRNSQIELLRILSMLFVVMHHYSYYGVLQNKFVYLSGSLINQIFVNVFLPGGIIGVAVFFMIAGYFGIQSPKVEISRIVKTVLFYSIFGVIVSVIVNGDSAENSEGLFLFVKMFLPISGSLYWFASVYVIIMLMKPVINDFFKSLKKSEQIVCLVGMLMLYSASRVMGVYYLGIINGLLFYFIGGFLWIIRSRLCLVKRKYWLYLFISSWGLYSVCSLCCSGVIWECIKICFFGTVSAIGIMCFFICGRAFSSVWVNKIASATFGVYLIHEHPLLRKIIWQDIFQVDTIQYCSAWFICFALLSIVSVFLFCTTIDLCRRRLGSWLSAAWKKIRLQFWEGR